VESRTEENENENEEMGVVIDDTFYGEAKKSL
jgi:hypothetical protein